MTEFFRRQGLESVDRFGGVDFHHPTALRPEARFGLVHLLVAARAGLFRSRLNASLARGADPCESRVLAYRATRLTSRRSREKLSASIDRVLRDAARPAPGLSVAVEPCGEEVAAAAALLIQVGEMLRSPKPVYCRGVAMLEDLLEDSGSALYWPAHRGALRHELEVILSALEGRESVANT